jgi:chemotaxis protein methyltransferase CheR
MREVRAAGGEPLAGLRPITRREFEQIRGLAREKFGLDLRNGKEELVAARLGKKIRQAGFGSFEQYYRHVVSDHSGEALIEMIDALTTNYTSFLREPGHFDFLRRRILPGLRQRGEIAVWSAGCATGEEPYTLAFTLLDELAGAPRPELRILATDISTRALESAKRAAYPADRFTDFPAGWLPRFFLRGHGRWEGWYRVKPEVRSLIEFRRQNLVEPAPVRGPFPLILCRNVMIYFDKPTQAGVVDRLAACLEPGGYLFIGHSESLAGVDHKLQYVEPAVYRKPVPGEALRSRARAAR